MRLVGATTENPYFEVNSALLSRARVYELQPLDDAHVMELLRRALADERGIADPPPVDDDALEFLAARAGGDARTALAALELAARHRARRRGDARDRGGRAAAQGGALRQGRRPPLRHDLGVDQVHARLGPRRVAALPRGDARGRRGPALHRAADGDPRERGHRQRRPARAAGGGGGRARRGARGHARVRAQPGPGVGLPGAGAEVERVATRRSSGRGAGCASTARPRPPAPAQRRLHCRAASSAAARATTTRTTIPRASPSRS